VEIFTCPVSFKIPILARSDEGVVDCHLRLSAAQKLGIAEVPVVLCDELEGDGRSFSDIVAERCPAGMEV
jgi:ParB-like chromosome segregation protein Spo0J